MPQDPNNPQFPTNNFNPNSTQNPNNQNSSPQNNQNFNPYQVINQQITPNQSPQTQISQNSNNNSSNQSKQNITNNNSQLPPENEFIDLDSILNNPNSNQIPTNKSTNQNIPTTNHTTNNNFPLQNNKIPNTINYQKSKFPKIMLIIIILLIGTSAGFFIFKTMYPIEFNNFMNGIFHKTNTGNIYTGQQILNSNTGNSKTTGENAEKAIIKTGHEISNLTGNTIILSGDIITTGKTAEILATGELNLQEKTGNIVQIGQLEINSGNSQSGTKINSGKILSGNNKQTKNITGSTKLTGELEEINSQVEILENKEEQINKLNSLLKIGQKTEELQLTGNQKCIKILTLRIPKDIEMLQSGDLSYDTYLNHLKIYQDCADSISQEF